MKRLKIVAVCELISKDRLEELEKDPDLFEFYSSCRKLTYILRLNMLVMKRQRTKCRSCGFYRRVKKGHWQEPDWESGAGICTNPRAARCKYINTIIGEEDYYEPISYTKRAVIDHHHFIAGWRKRSFRARLLADGELKRRSTK